MKANFNLYPASSSANVSLNRLKEVVNIGNNIGLHLFHGILNSDGDSPPRHIYCYCISFLQMFLHCEDMFDYFSQEDLKDKNEILIHDIIKSMKDKKVKKFIQIYNFISSWKGWNNRRMPRKMKDIRYFVRFFLKSLSQTIQDFFYIDIDSAERTVYGYSFYLQIPSTADTLQKNLDLKLSTCYNIRKLPKYLLLYMDREENGGGFKTNYVAVNTYITIANHNYRFLSSVLYTGTYKSGHYSTLIKLANKHFYFNDNDVYPVFFTKNSTSKTPNLVYDINNGLNRNSVLFLYEDFNDQFDPGAFEIIDNRVYKNKEIVSNLSRFFKDISNDPNIQMSNSNDNSQNNSQDNSGFNSQDNSQYNSGFNSQNSSQNNSDDDSNSFFLFSTVSSNISSYSTESSSDNDDNINTNDDNTNDDNTNDDNTNDDNTNTNKNNSKNQSNSFPRPFIEANPSDNDALQLNQVESTPVSPRYISLVRYASQKFNLSESLIDEILGKNLNVSNHSGLQKEKVIVENLNATNLNGVLFIHNNGIPSCSKTNDEKGKFMIYRKLFLYAGSVLKNLEFNDLGKTNSETYKIKLNIPQILAEEIKEKGKLVYKILRKIIDEGDFSYQKVKERLMPILNWYRNKFSNIMTRDVLSNKAIDDNLGKVLKENIFSRSGDDFFSLSTEDLLNTEEEEDQINIEDDIEKELNTRQYNEEEEEEEEEEQEEEEENVEYKKNLRSGNDYRLGYHDYLPSDDQSDLNQINLFDDEPDLTGDDNEFVLGEYDWKNRAKFTDAKDIREKLVDLFSNHPDQIPRGKIELRSLIISEFLNEYTQMGYLFPSRSKFIDDYISRNSDPLTKSKIVKEYEDIIERENQRIKKERHKRKTKEEKKIHEKRQKKTTFIYGKSTLDEKIRWFESCDEQQRYEILAESNVYGDWGGKRPNISVVTDETLDCLLSLVLDFPTMSAANYTEYLNSKYGPNHDNPISLRTVYTCLKMMKLTVKKASFAPPNRNSVGLRLFRVAWCKFMKRILKTNNNILLGFVDEAGITVNEGRTFGRAYAGITPVINCPLSKIKMTIISVVFPGFGVLYKMINKSVDGNEYAQFLSDVNEFIRKYICNNQTDVILIEDNCPMHRSKCVENVLNHISISLIPIVPYSPALNGVVEGYFGFVKLKNIQTAGNKGELAQRREIEKNWKKITQDKFKLETCHSLYREWYSRMNECIEGKPIITEHIAIDQKIDASKLDNVTVNRVNN